MLLAIFSTLIGAVATILWKKSLKLTDLTGMPFSIFGYFAGILITIIFMVIGKIDYSIFTNHIILFIIVIIIILEIYGAKIEQVVYKEEKYSTIMPFENLEKIFVVIIGYFLFGNSSLTTLFITIFTILIIFLFNIDYKNFEVPRYIKNIFLVNICWAGITIINVYALKIINTENFFAIGQIFQALVIFIIAFFAMNKKINFLFNQKKEFYFYRFGGNIFWAINYLITLFLISELGIIITILLSFLGIIFKLIFSYFLLKEIPTKKDLLLGFIVLVLIGFGYYFG